MRLASFVAASAGIALSGTAALLAIWWSKRSAKRKLNESVHVIIVNDEEFTEKKQILFRAGKSSLQVIMDFDYTMTQYRSSSGDIACSTHGMLSRSGLLPESFGEREAELFLKYYKHEVDPNLSPSERYRYMEEWWQSAHANLLDHGVNRQMLQQCFDAENCPILLRRGCRELINLLEQNEIPLLVFSAGIADIIEPFFSKQAIRPSGMHILSNRMVMNSNGLLIGFQEPVIHSSNKALLVDRAAHVLHPDRSAFIVVGDHVHDALMCDSIPYAEVHLKIGLLNSDVEERINQFKEVFDVIIVNDGPLHFLVDIIQEIIMN